MNKKTLAIISNSLIVLFEIIGLYISLKQGLSIFYYYTEDSNLLAGIASIFLLIYLLKKKDISEVPTWVLMLKYISVCCLALTLLVVLFILIPQNILSNSPYPWYNMLISGANLYMHVLNPIIALVSFMFFENDKRYNRKKILIYPIIATLIYGIVMIIINYLDLYIGPYFFLMVKTQKLYMSAIWIAVILVINYLIAKIILVQNQKRVPRRNPRRPS